MTPQSRPWPDVSKMTAWPANKYPKGKSKKDYNIVIINGERIRVPK